MKTTAILLVTATTAGALGAWAMRPKCGRAVATDPAPVTRVAAASVPVPSVIESFPMPATSEPRRNVFGFVEDRRPRLSSSSPPPAGQAGAPVLHREDTTVVVRPPDPPPAYRYLGSFGTQETPILVYKGNGDVVNVPLRKP